MMDLLRQLEEYRPFNEQEERDRNIIIRCLKEEKDIFTRDNAMAHMTASAWVVNRQRTKVLMAYHNIYQSWSWLGGHADGEQDLLQVAVREVKEETGLTVLDYRFNKSEYFAKSNTLMVNFACTVDSENFTLRKGEVDRAGWFSVEEARAQIYHDSLAEKFLLSAIEKRLYQA